MTVIMGICGKMRSSINFSIFPNFSKDEASPVSPNSMKPKKNFEGEFVGLGIVAAMNEIRDSDSTQSRPIPIVSSSKSVVSASFVGSDDCASESYTCVIYRIGNIGGTVKERERFDVVRYGSRGGGECERKCGVFFESPLKKRTEVLRKCEMSSSDFLSFCYLCRKKLHGLDIFMYSADFLFRRGDQAFCSAECRCKQILRDERKDSYGMTKKSLDCAASPCSAHTLFAAGVAAA
ncbi:hypothetical protein Sjap_023089 [Stephania japonica]|uniref:FLZ-type domain-containing protein n=1 Tax=Stephania japonica TaxID=461633 RepID=A0AAP0EVH7_9MAGN